MKIPTPPTAPLHFVHESHIDAPPESVFAFHAHPDALKRLIPPWEPVSLESRSGGLEPGSRVVLVMRAGPLWLRWIAVHTEYDPPRSFADWQERGPFRWWYHRHLILPDGNGTRLRDEVAYLPPLGAIGRAIAPRLIEPRLRRMFVYRHDATRAAMKEFARS